MICLGIETSCDDTSLALVRDGKLLAQASSSQADLHALFGGVVPEMASREHGRLIGPLCDALLDRAGITAAAVDVVAVARGPGLLGSLLVGVAFGKAFALGAAARFLGINHLHAHIFAAGLDGKLELPALALLVSGGHTHLYRVEGPSVLHLLGKTLDDAAGEAFDKAGKMLGLPYPAGRIMDELANEGTACAKLFPRPYLNNETLDFSFSGLKTAMAAHIASHQGLIGKWDARDGQPYRQHGPERAALANLCASYRLAIVESLSFKVRKALLKEKNKGLRTLSLSGGVAANSLLRGAMREIAMDAGLAFSVPSVQLCMDNGAMIAYLGWILASAGHSHALSMETIPKGRPVPDDMLKEA